MPKIRTQRDAEQLFSQHTAAQPRVRCTGAANNTPVRPGGASWSNPQLQNHPWTRAARNPLHTLTFCIMGGGGGIGKEAKKTQAGSSGKENQRCSPGLHNSLSEPTVLLKYSHSNIFICLDIRYDGKLGGVFQRNYLFSSTATNLNSQLVSKEKLEHSFTRREQWWSSSISPPLLFFSTSQLNLCFKAKCLYLSSNK